MRTGFNGGWLEEAGKLVGISLGADYCAEHEFGIADLKRMLGVDGVGPNSRTPGKYTQPHGLPRRKISKHDSVRLYEKKDVAVLICESAWWHERFQEDIRKLGEAKAFMDGLPMHLPKPKEGIGTAWSEDDFGIFATGHENIEKLHELYAAFQADNVAIWVGGGGVFENGGLILAIADLVPAAGAETLRNADLDKEKLAEACERTGILKRLEAAGLGYFACRASWFDRRFEPNGQKKETAHPVVYWLNPMEQHKNNFGWYTVEELDQWIQGTGPIPKGEKASA